MAKFRCEISLKNNASSVVSPLVTSAVSADDLALLLPSATPDFFQIFAHLFQNYFKIVTPFQKEHSFSFVTIFMQQFPQISGNNSSFSLISSRNVNEEGQNFQIFETEIWRNNTSVSPFAKSMRIKNFEYSAHRCRQT